MAAAEFSTGARGCLRATRNDSAISIAPRPAAGGNIASATRSREIAHARSGYGHRGPTSGAMDGAGRFREVDSAISAGPNHTGKCRDQLDQRAGGRSFDATWARAARLDCSAATGGENDFAQRDRER